MLKVVTSAPYVRFGDHSVGVVMRGFLKAPHACAMHQRVPAKNIRLQLRHGGTQIFPFDFGGSSPEYLERVQTTTQDLVVTAWFSADGSEGPFIQGVTCRVQSRVIPTPCFSNFSP